MTQTPEEITRAWLDKCAEYGDFDGGVEGEVLAACYALLARAEAAERERGEALADLAEAFESNVALRARAEAAERALTRIAEMTDVEADFDGFEARRIARAALTEAKG